MYDPLGTVVVELREDAGVAALTTRIRGAEPAPGDVAKPGETAPFQRFVVVTRQAAVPPRSGVPTQTVTVGIRAYGTTPQDAAALMGACAAALHHVGPRRGTGDGHIYSSHFLSATADRDPDTRQPVEMGVIEIVCTQ